MKKFEVYAHCGGRFPPNHMSTFHFAGTLGVDGIETDICLTSDGEPIIYHPGTLKPPEPTSMTWKQLLRQDYRVSHLDAFLGYLSIFRRLKCLLDIKIYSRDLVQKIVAKTSDKEFRERIFLTAPKKKSRTVDFHVDAGLLEYARELDNRVKIHIIDTLPLNMAGTVKKYRTDMISFGWLNDSLASRVLFRLIFKSGLKNASREVKKAQNEGAKVMAGIANTAEEVRELLTLFPTIDAIITDNPAMALSMRDWPLSL
mgnify:FL=1